jgi:hypothetical protein
VPENAIFAPSLEGSDKKMFKDLHNEISVRVAIVPQSQSGNIALQSGLVDRKGGSGGNFEALEFLIESGAIGTGAATFTTTVTHGDLANGSDQAAVASTDLLGTLAGASFTGANPNSAFRLGYIGARRYVQLTITIAANASPAFISALALLAAPAVLPTP